MPATGARRRSPPIPLGEGVAGVPITVSEEDLVVVGAILSGYDGLGSIHGDGERVIVVTPEGQLQALLSLLEEVAREVPLQIGSPVAYRPAP